MSSKGLLPVLAVLLTFASSSPTDKSQLSQVLLPSTLEEPVSLYRTARSDGYLGRYGSGRGVVEKVPRYEIPARCSACFGLSERSEAYRRPEGGYETGWRNVDRYRSFAPRDRVYAERDRDRDSGGRGRPTYDDRDDPTGYDDNKKSNSSDDRNDHETKTRRPVSKFDIPKDDRRYSDRDDGKNDFFGGGRPSYRPSYGSDRDRDRDRDRDYDDDRRRRPSYDERRPSYDERRPYDEDRYGDDDRGNDRGYGGVNRGYGDRDSGDRRYGERGGYGGDRGGYGDDRRYGERGSGYGDDRFGDDRYGDRNNNNGGGRYGERGQDRRYPERDYYDRDSSYRGNGYDDRGYDNRANRYGSFRPWDETYRGTAGFDDGGRGFYFATGRPSPDSSYEYRYGRRPGPDGESQYGYWSSGSGRDYNRDQGGYRVSSASGGGGDYNRGGTGYASGWQNVGDRRDNYYGGRGSGGYRDQSTAVGGGVGGYRGGQEDRYTSSTPESTSYLHERPDSNVPVTEPSEAKNLTKTTS